MKTKIQIKTMLGSLLFEYEKKGNSVKETVIEAVKNKAYLRGAYLSGADLTGADLTGAYLYLFGKWYYKIFPFEDKIGIGCKEKTISEWETWFSTKQKYEVEPNSREYQLIENGFKMACIAVKSFEIMIGEKPGEKIS